MSKKILFIVSGLLNTGGIEKYNQNLVRATLEVGYSVRIISRNDIEDKFDNIPIASYGRIKYDISKKIAFSLRVLLEVLFFSPDMIICGHINFSPLCYLVSKFLKKKYIVLTYGIDVWHINSSVKLQGLKNANLIISISNFTKEKIVKQIPKLKNKIKLLPPTINSSLFYPKPKPIYLIKRHNLKGNNKIILTVARLKRTEEYKGYYKILDVLPDIVKKIPEIKYILVGSGDDLENIQRYIEKKNLKKIVILTGYIPDNELPDYYNLCDIFIMPSKKEGFGIVFLEALACGKPVIAGNKDGSADVALGGDIGILIDPDNLEEIKKAIISVLKGEVDKKLFNGKYLRERVLKEYGFESFMERIRLFFEE